MFKKLLQYHLRFLAKGVLKKYQSLIIGVTGSVGKTSTKEAIYTVLRSHFRVSRNQTNYNNELGVPLAILDQEAVGRSVWGWLQVLLAGWRQVLFGRKDFPEILVLEMGADKPRDIEYLTNLAPCFIGVVTAVGDVPAHVEFFEHNQDVAKEKSYLVKNLPNKGWAILNYDDPLVRNMRQVTRAQVLTYGLEERADIFASDINLWQDNDWPRGLAFKVNYKGNSVPVRVDHLLSRPHIANILAAIACGLALDLNLIEIVEALRKIKPLPGRLNLIAGIKQSLIIDDTYNAAPAAMLAALDVLAQFTKQRKVAILGDMLELGSQSEKTHRQIGLKAAAIVDILITVGLRAKFVSQTAQIQGLAPARIYHFDEAETLMAQIEDLINPNDVILVKASQGMRFEKIVKDIMADPMQAKELLVRQDDNWLKKS